MSNSNDQLTREQLRDTEQANALIKLEENNFKGLVHVAPRVGKTIIGIRSIARIQQRLSRDVKALWVTFDRELRDNSVPKEFEKFGYSNLISNTKVICWQSLSKETGKYDIIILDEYQSITEKNCVALLTGTLYSDHIIGMTATKPKHEIKKYIIHTLLKLKEVATLTIDDAAELGIINDYRVTLVKFNLDDCHKKFKVIYKNKPILITEKQMYDRYTRYIKTLTESNASAKFEHDSRAKLIYNSSAKEETVKRIMNKMGDKRGLVFLPYKNQVERLGPYYHSTSGQENYVKFKNNEVNTLALIRAGSVGHTYENIDYIVIGQITKDFSGLTTQSWARGLTFREGKPVDIFICVARDTVEEVWIKQTLSDVDVNKISTIDL